MFYRLCKKQLFYYVYVYGGVCLNAEPWKHTLPVKDAVKHDIKPTENRQSVRVSPSETGPALVVLCGHPQKNTAGEILRFSLPESIRSQGLENG